MNQQSTTQNTMPENGNDSALRWRCRRGMLELDIIFNHFLDSAYADLSADEKRLMDQLLDYPDQLLFDLLMDKMKSTDKGISQLVTRIRHALTA